MLPAEQVQNVILILRGQKVILDADLARLYGVSTKRLNEQVKRNRNRFPQDFMFQLNDNEKVELVAICDRFENLKHSSALPFAFTEHGTVMLASVLNSPMAVEVSVQVVRAFIRLREIFATHKDLAKKLEELEKKYDSQFKVIFDTIRQMMIPPVKPRRIGFVQNSEE